MINTTTTQASDVVSVMMYRRWILMFAGTFLLFSSPVYSFLSEQHSRTFPRTRQNINNAQFDTCWTSRLIILSSENRRSNENNKSFVNNQNRCSLCMTNGRVEDTEDVDALPTTTNSNPSSSASSSPDTSGQNDLPTPSFPFLPAAVATLAFVLFWPLLAFVRGGNHYYFDVDMFLALKGILDTTPDYDRSESILELPPLSPAEQLVGAIFGPPR